MALFVSKSVISTQRLRRPLEILNNNSKLYLSISNRTLCDGNSFTNQKFEFIRRHIGPSESDKKLMLEKIGVKSFKEMIQLAIPKSIKCQKFIKLSDPLTEGELITNLRKIADRNEVWRSYIGMGYNNCITPAPIARNIFENPGWITSYTPYQPEISQGRLECLLNFQTMICDLTGMQVANASLLDEGTAAAEAMGVAIRKTQRKKFFIDSNCHPQTIDVVKTRADGFDVEIVVDDISNANLSSELYSGILLQYPNTNGTVIVNIQQIVEKAKQSKTMTIVAGDLLSWTILKPPGEFDVDIVVGSSQRFGIPLGYGGPHAAFFATKKEFIRMMPGRMVGVSKDINGKPAYRLALQTREQHIRRDKATSNICTAQALLANMAAMYGIYHGPDGLKEIGKRIHLQTLILADGCLTGGHKVLNNGLIFDTLHIMPGGDKENLRIHALSIIKRRADSLKINLQYRPDLSIIVSLDETVTYQDLSDLLSIFGSTRPANEILTNLSSDVIKLRINRPNNELARTSSYLTHPVFNSHHSETCLVRYMKQLENKDISLVHSMIPLGSCTMKLNSTVELNACSWPEFSQIHPFVPINQVQGYAELFKQLEQDLCEITGYDKFSLQPNSGAQGEYAGLRVILSYFKAIEQSNRNICLIPTSAHGTNPASAQMAGMIVKPVKVNKDGSVDMQDLEVQVSKYRDDLAAIMVTYPSTNGVFDKDIRVICDIVHENGGQVYLDGANLNAQVGLCRPGEYGSDVSHLNLHKTFCIPHGGGGPGVGPIGVKAHLAPYLPSHMILPPTVLTGEAISGTNSFGPVTSAPFGSASILPISWAYIKLMGFQGLKHASEVAILNANYMMKRLEGHYKSKYVNENGFCAHEFIIDCHEFKNCGIEVIDISKRLMDYGFHSPTMSWPVISALMIEPTESEDKNECDRLCDALIQIREEIKMIEEGKLDPHNNPLKMAPHSQEIVCSDNWNRKYSRVMAAYPAYWQRTGVVSKFWPSVGRIDDKFGDQHLMCSCPSVEEIVQSSELLFK